MGGGPPGKTFKRVVWGALAAAGLLLLFGLLWPSTKNCAELGCEEALRYITAFRDQCGAKCCPEVARRFNKDKPYSGFAAWLLNKNARVYVGDRDQDGDGDGSCNYVVNFHGGFPCHDFGMLWDSRKPDELACERCGCGELFEAAGFKVKYSR